MSLYDEHPLPWRAEKMPGIRESSRLGDWWVLDADQNCLGISMFKPVAKLLAGAPGVADAAESVLLDADQSEEAPEISMVSTADCNRLREALGQTEVAP